MKRKQGGTRNIPSDVIIYFSILSRGYQIPASLGAEGTASLLVVLIAVLPRPGDSCRTVILLSRRRSERLSILRAYIRTVGSPAGKLAIATL